MTAKRPPGEKPGGGVSDDIIKTESNDNHHKRGGAPEAPEQDTQWPDPPMPRGYKEPPKLSVLVRREREASEQRRRIAARDARRRRLWSSARWPEGRAVVVEDFAIIPGVAAKRRLREERTERLLAQHLLIGRELRCRLGRMLFKGEGLRPTPRQRQSEEGGSDEHRD